VFDDQGRVVSGPAKIISAADVRSPCLNIRTTREARNPKGTQNKKNHMKAKMIGLACVAIAPLAFAQTNVTEPGAERSSKGSTAPAASVAPAATGQIVTVDTLIPGKSIAVTPTAQAHSLVYTLSDNTSYVTESGNTVNPTNIRTGTRVRLEVSGTGTSRTVDRVIVLGQ
jgi:hypothetical protein